MKRAGVYATLAVAVLVCGRATAQPAHAFYPKDEMAKQAAAKDWKEVFGDEIDFADDDLYDYMAYVYPQPDRRLVDLDDKKVRGPIRLACSNWLERVFRPACRLDIESNPAEKYYLRRGGEPSLLYYEWKTPKYSFRMYETDDGFLTRIVPKGYDPKKLPSSQELATLLFDVYALDYPSAEKLGEAFRLPKAPKVGDFFTNARELDAHGVSAWQEHVLGFLSHEDICVLTFKSTAGRICTFRDFLYFRPFL